MDESIRVLHVDDEPDFAELTATALEREDDRFRVDTATSSTEGLDRLAETEFDCVVSDYDMPDRTGIEFLETVREDHPDLPFILFTGKGSEAVASDAISAGVTDYLQKETGTGQYPVLANRVRNAVSKHRAEQAVAETERRYRRLIEEAADVITTVDRSGRFEYVSPSVESVLGYDVEAVAGENAFGFVHPDDHAVAVDQFQAFVADPGGKVTLEARFENADGEWVWLEVRGRNLLEDPVIDGLVVYARDITARKERERELERQNERLDKFAGVVSHDLRNPLNVAKSRVELAREERDGEHLGAAADALDRTTALLDGLLALAREGERVSDREPVDVPDHAEDCWRNVATSEATLVVDEAVTVAADRSRLAQVLENLFRNAVEHGSTSPRQAGDAVEHGSTSPRDGEDAVEHGSTGSRTRSDDAVEHAGEGVTVTVGALEDGFYVADDGPGVPESERERVFESGYSTAEEGTGFGLAIVAEIVQAHGWAVEVGESAAGGARFEITGADRLD
jgi:PAS domain S-box-containing protein